MQAGVMQMTRLGYFGKADCTLYRIPPLDMTEFEGTLEEAMLAAWRSGRSPDDAIGRIVNNSELVDKLAAQVTKNLDFQRGEKLAAIAQQREQEAKKYQAHREERLKTVAEMLEPQKQEAKTQYDQVTTQVTTQHASYTAAQRDFERMQQQISEQLKSIGGDEGLKHLLVINEELYGNQGTEASAAPTPEKKKASTTRPATKKTQDKRATLETSDPADQYNGENDTQDATTSAPVANALLSDDGIDEELTLMKTRKQEPKSIDAIAREATSPDAADTDEQKVKRGFFGSIGHAVYKVLTYELW